MTRFSPRQSLPLAALALLVTGCTAVPAPSSPAGSAAPVTRAPAPTRPEAPRPGFIAPTVLREPGLETLVGRRAEQAIALLGTPRLDTPEGDSRKLQWVGEACVLDAWLYPLAPGQTPVVTHLEARRASDAADVERAACLAALSARGR